MKNTAALQQLYEAFLAKHPFRQPPEGLYEPVDYILGLGGKRLRPVLALLGYQLFRNDVEVALPVAQAVEVFHNFSLVHDDIMDEAPLRRGSPTVHRRFGVPTAVLSGDVMLVYAYDFLLGCPATTAIPDLMRVFNRVAIEVCEGQQMDMEFESRHNVGLEEYIEMIGKKTAALISGSLELGALAAGAPKNDVERLAAFGRAIGIAFQLQDDILDTFGQSAKVGKKIGGDIIQNKKTFLILKALEKASPDQRRRLTELMTTQPADEDRKIREVTELLRSLDVPRMAEEAKAGFQATAFEHFAAVAVSADRKESLSRLTRQLIGREA